MASSADLSPFRPPERDDAPQTSPSFRWWPLLTAAAFASASAACLKALWFSALLSQGLVSSHMSLFSTVSTFSGFIAGLVVFKVGTKRGMLLGLIGQMSTGVLLLGAPPNIMVGPALAFSGGLFDISLWVMVSERLTASPGDRRDALFLGLGFLLSSFSAGGELVADLQLEHLPKIARFLAMTLPVTAGVLVFTLPGQAAEENEQKLRPSAALVFVALSLLLGFMIRCSAPTPDRLLQSGVPMLFIRPLLKLGFLFFWLHRARTWADGVLLLKTKRAFFLIGLSMILYAVPLPEPLSLHGGRLLQTIGTTIAFGVGGVMVLAMGSTRWAPIRYGAWLLLRSLFGAAGSVVNVRWLALNSPTANLGIVLGALCIAMGFLSIILSERFGPVLTEKSD